MRLHSLLFIGMVSLFFVLIFSFSGYCQYREYYIYGTVVDADNQPVTGVEINLQDINTSRSYKISTDKKGQYKIVGLPHGIYQVTISKEGYKTQTTEWNFSTPQDRIQKVEIEPIVMATEEQIQKVERAKQAQEDFNEATRKVQQGDFDGAIDILKNVIQENQQDANAYYLLGISYLKKKMLPEAIEALTRTTELVPSFAPAYHQIGAAYGEKGEEDKTIEFYDKALELNPMSPDSLYNKGLILFEQNRVPEALTLFERAIKVNPDDPEFLEMAGRCSIHQGDFARAIDYLEKAKGLYKGQEKIEFLEQLITKLKEQIKK